MTVQYIEHLALVHNPEVLVIMMWAYRIIVGKSVYKTSKLEIDWASSWLTSLWTPSSKAKAHGLTVTMHCNKGHDNQSTNFRPPDIGKSTAAIDLISEIHVYPDGNPRESSQHSPVLESEILIVTIFDNNIAMNKTLQMLALWIVKSSQLLEMTMEVTTLEGDGENESINPSGGWVQREQQQKVWQFPLIHK